MLISLQGDLFLLHTETGKWEQLTATPEQERDPKLSPDGRFVSFRREHDLYSLEVASKKVTRLTGGWLGTLWNGELDWVYPEELDLSTAHWWSPDSSQIAYLQFDVGRESIFPQVDLLSWRALTEPERFPQPGTPNAEVRLGWWRPRRSDALDGHRRNARPPAGARRLGARQPRGGLPAAESRTEPSGPGLRGRANGRLAGAPDRTGFLLGQRERRLPLSSIRANSSCGAASGTATITLYLCSVDDKHVSQMTKGEWEVTEVAGVNEETREVFFVSTEQSPLERQLYRVRLDGKQKQRLSGGAGTHSISMSPTTAVLYGYGFQPGHAAAPHAARERRLADRGVSGGHARRIWRSCPPRSSSSRPPTACSSLRA
jgi:dipeptidyl-peptidase-4